MGLVKNIEGLENLDGYNLRKKLREDARLIKGENLREKVKNEVLFIDGSASSENDFTSYIYDINSYSGLQRELLEDEIYFNEWFLDLLNSSSSYTTSDITSELKEYKRILYDKKHIFSINQSMFEKHRKKYKISENQYRFDELLRVVNDICYISGKSELKKHSEHQELCEKLKKIIDETVIKNSYSTKSFISDADISLATATFYSAQNKKSSLLTKDFHFLDIFSITLDKFAKEGIRIPEFNIYFRDEFSTDVYAFSSSYLKNKISYSFSLKCG